MLRLTSPIVGRKPVLGPEHSGMYMTVEEMNRARLSLGYVYELIDGILNVSPNASQNHDFWASVVANALRDYARRSPRRIQRVSEGAVVVIPGRPGATRPEPDVAAYANFPRSSRLRWDDFCPVIVAEVISPRRTAKDTLRNRHLYWAAGGIVEYWILDPTDDPNRPLLNTNTRRPGAVEWISQTFAFGKTYKSAAFPKLTLNLKDRSSKS